MFYSESGKALEENAQEIVDSPPIEVFKARQDGL